MDAAEVDLVLRPTGWPIPFDVARSVVLCLQAQPTGTFMNALDLASALAIHVGDVNRLMATPVGPLLQFRSHHGRLYLRLDTRVFLWRLLQCADAALDETHRVYTVPVGDPVTLPLLLDQFACGRLPAGTLRESIVRDVSVYGRMMRWKADLERLYSKNGYAGPPPANPVRYRRKRTKRPRRR
jgi:hypothetical protein